MYETRAPATIDKLGDRYVLTVRCDGIHRIYVRATPTLDLERFVGKLLRARYRYVYDANPQTRCVRAPCPPAVDRVIDIVALEYVPGVTVPDK